MSPEQIDGLSICLIMSLMTLAISPMLVWGVGDRRA